MARMSQEKMENTIYTTQPETIGISSEILHKHTCNCFYDKLVFYKWKCCWICANRLRAEATSLWEIDGKAINVTDTHKNCQTHTCLLWIYAGNHIQTHLFSLTPPVCCTALKRWCLWEQAPSFEGQKRRIRDTSIHHPFDPLWENLNSLGQGLNNNKKSSKTELIFLFVLHRMAYSFFSLAGTNWATVDLFSSEGDVGCGKAGISIGRWCEQS